MPCYYRSVVNKDYTEEKGYKMMNITKEEAHQELTDYANKYNLYHVTFGELKDYANDIANGKATAEDAISGMLIQDAILHIGTD